MNTLKKVGMKRTVAKRCWQCKSTRQKVVQPASYSKPAPKFWHCVNDCGPESLGKMFRIG